jgi:hypothetical protein
MTDSLQRVDEEIRRLAAELAAMDRVAGGSSGVKIRAVKVPDYSNVPSLEAEIPRGFPRAPITHPYDPAKAERLAAAEAELRDSLLGKNRQDTLALLSRIHRHQSAHAIVDKSTDTTKSASVRPEDPVRDYVLSNLIGTR